MSAPKPSRLSTRTVPLERILEAQGFNPRQDYGQEDGSFAELVASIREHGVLQAPLVRETREGGSYAIIGGHRRVRAAREAGLEQLTVGVLPFVPGADDFPLALIENLHRKDLDPVERARGFQRMVDTGLSLHQVSKVLGLSYSYIQRQMDLLVLPASVQKAVSAKALPQLSAVSIARGIKDGLSVTKATQIAKAATRNALTTYEVADVVKRATGKPVAELRTPSEVILAVPYSKKPLVDWAIRRYGSLAGALEALQEMSGMGPPKAEEPSAVNGSVRDPMAVVRAAQSRKWPEILVGYNGATGALRATPTGPLPVGYVLICTIMGTGTVQVPMTANGPGRSLGERIKDSIEGPKKAGLK